MSSERGRLRASAQPFHFLAAAEDGSLRRDQSDDGVIAMPKSPSIGEKRATGFRVSAPVFDPFLSFTRGGGSVGRGTVIDPRAAGAVFSAKAEYRNNKSETLCLRGGRSETVASDKTCGGLSATAADFTPRGDFAAATGTMQKIPVRRSERREENQQDTVKSINYCSSSPRDSWRNRPDLTATATGFSRGGSHLRSSAVAFVPGTERMLDPKRGPLSKHFTLTDTAVKECSLTPELAREHPNYLDKASFPPVRCDSIIRMPGLDGRQRVFHLVDEEGRAVATPRDAAAALSPSAKAFSPRRGLKQPADPSSVPVCRFFFSGACRKGLSCPFLHDASSATNAVTNSAVSSSTTEEMPSPVTEVIDVGDGIKCEVGPGASIVRLILGDGAEQSKTVVVSGLPTSTSEQAVRGIFAPFGPLAALSVQRGENGAVYATATFPESSMALAATEALHGTTQQSWTTGKQLKQQTELLVSVVAKNSHAATSGVSIKIQWYKPSRCAWVHFWHFQEAQKAAKALDQQSLGGRVISAKIQRPSVNQKTSFSVWIGNLAGDLSESVTKKTLMRFVHSRAKVSAVSVKLGDAPFSERDAPSIVKKLLETHGGQIVSFVKSSTSDDALKTKALVKMAHAGHAENVFRYFSKQRGVPELGGYKLFVQLVFSAKYTIPTSAVASLVPELASIVKECGKVRHTVFPGPATSSVSIHADEREELSDAKAKLEKVLGGEVVRDNARGGGKLWDRYVVSPEFVGKLHEVVGPDVGVVLCDKRRQEIRVFGSENRRKRVIGKLVAHCTEAALETHAVPTSKAEFDHILRNGREVLDKIIRASGASRVSLDVKNRSLLVEGRLGEARRAREHVARLLQQRNMKETISECPVCLCEVAQDSEETCCLACKHVYCRECFSMWLTGSNTGICKFPVTCLEEKCQEMVSLADMRKHVDHTAFFRLVRASLDDHVRRNASTCQFCISPACMGIYKIEEDTRKGECSSCSLIVCGDCRAGHDGLTCKQYALASVPPDRLRLKIVDEILTLCCPRCKQAFLDFDGCFALSCSGCPCRFCGWCLKDCGSDAHPHVKACPENPRRGNYFGTREEFSATQNERRRRKLIEFLATLSEEEREATIQSIQQDLNDLRLQL